MTFAIFQVKKGQQLDLVIGLGKSVSQLGLDKKPLYRQNGMYAALDDKDIYHPIGHYISEGKLTRYYKDLPWSAFVIPKVGIPYIDQVDITKLTNVKTAFYLTPSILKNGEVSVNSAAEKTANDIKNGSNFRSLIGITKSGTIVLVRTKTKLTLQQAGQLLKNLGYYNGGNLDGGGSVQGGEGEYTHGYERPVSSALVVSEEEVKEVSFNPFDNYILKSPLGMRMHPIDKVMKYHRGVDLVITPANANGAISAFTAGEVMYAKAGVDGIGIFPQMGIVVAIKDIKNRLHLYCHLSAALVKVGSKVERGQVIGRQGTTGASTGNHLHYEIRKKSSPYFGWEKSDSCVFEPTQYLIDFYKPAAPKPVDALTEALNVLVAKGIIVSPAYWLENAKAGKTAKGDYVAGLIQNVAKYLQK